MKERLLRLALIAAIALAMPAVAAADPGHGQQVKAEKQHQGQKEHQPTTGQPEDTGKPDDAGKPSDTGKPDDTGKPESAGERKHNHGWFVSQVARDESKVATNAEGESTHGAAVSAVAQSDQGK